MGKKYLVIDTETAGNIHKPETIRVYDIGWTVQDARGNVLARRSYIVRETWENSALMDSAYYANKLPQYREGIERGAWSVRPLNTIRQHMLLDMVEHGISEVYAYNCDFDRKALNSTITAYSKGYVTEWLPSSVAWLDVWGYAQDTICATADYIKWAIERDALTESGNVSTNAEWVYRYLSKNEGFIEAHTAADDADIEAYILRVARSKPRKGSFECGSRWRKLKELRAQLGI